MKTLLAVLGVVLLVVIAILPLGCARHNKTETFSGYGFSFEYPAGSEVIEKGNGKGEANSYSSGSVMVMQGTGLGDSVGFWMSWATTKVGMSPDEGVLGAHFGSSVIDLKQGMEEDGSSVQVSEIVEDSCSGHKMLRCYYVAATSDGTNVNGEVAEVYCDESRRLLGLLTESSHTETESEALALFRVFTSSLVCH